MTPDEPPQEAAPPADTDDGATADAAPLERVRERVPAFQYLLGVSSGVLAFAGGFVVLLLLVVLGPGEFLADASMGERVRSLAAVYYSAHNVGLVAASPDVIIYTVTGEANLVWGAEDPALPKLVYFAVPIAVLVATGALFAATREAVESKAQTALLTAGTLAVGYGVVAVLGTYLVVLTLNNGNFHPTRTGAALFGFAYPLVCGWVGAIVGLAWRDRQ